MAGAEGGAGFEFAFERGGEGDDEKVGGGVESDRDDAEYGELQEDLAAIGSDELRNEGEEEESCFGIEGFGEHSLFESARFWCWGGWRKGVGFWCRIPSGIFRRRSFRRRAFRHGQVARADHFDAKEDQVGGASVLDGVESDGRGGEDGGNSGGGGENMEESTEESAEGGLKTFAAASGKGAGENVENARTGSNGEEKSGGEEEQ